MISIGTFQTDTHLFGIGTEGVQCFYRRFIAISTIEEIAINVIILIGVIIIGIRIESVTATIYVAVNSGVDTDSITAIYRTRHVVTAIDIMHKAATYQRTGRQLGREFIKQITVFVLVLQVCTRHIDTVHRRHHVCHTAAAIEVVDNERGVSGNLKEQTFRTGHVTLVTTAVEVTYLTCQEVPCRTDMHLCLVVTTEEATNLVGTTAGLREAGVDTHLLETLRAE